MTIEKRMDKLERQNRRLKQVVALIAILGVSGALMGAKHVPKQIVARSILIKGKSGRTVRLTETGLEMRDAKGNMRGAFYGGLIYFYRKGGKGGFRLNREGFRPLGKKGIVRMVVSERGMSLYDGIRGKLRLRANVNAKGNPLVSLFDGNQRTRTKLGVANLSLYDKRQRRRVLLNVHQKGDAVLRVNGAKKRRISAWAGGYMAAIQIRKSNGKLEWEEATRGD